MVLVQTDVPTVSIVVPIYNREQFLQDCLESLFTQTYPHDRYEIMLVDDGSTDRTVEVANALAQSWKGKFQIIQKANGGPASARNAGFRASQSDIIAYMDSDCVAEPDWLERVVTELATTDLAGVGGPIVTVMPNNWLSRYLRVASFYHHRVHNGQVDYLLTANVAFRREALLKVDGFREEEAAWSEDADLSFRLQQAGFSLGVIPIGRVTHYGAPLTLRNLSRNTFRHGRGNAILSRYWKNRRTPLVELIRHGGAVILSPFIVGGYIKKAGFWSALSFMPIVITVHSSFVAGLISGIMHNLRKSSHPPTMQIEQAS